MIEGAERRQRTLTGFPGASHVLSKLPFRTTPRCPVVLPARYRGLKKTSLQHACIGAAINLVRVVDWISDKPRWRDRPSQFAALRPVA